MTTHGRERGGELVQTQVRGDEGDLVLPNADEFRASFQGQSDPGFARQRSQQARSARAGLMAAGALVALVCLTVMVGRLTSGTQAGVGVGTVVYGLSLAFAGLSVELARRARTRWAMMAIILAAAGASLADAMP
ncbi:hypothetical protein QQM39_10710 [Streptomyces sp. DT2A-34]|uniref:hypothetical protein n=1 Tax=Streptomyces sp. DT2A-34 TaxID=3051182 RepID=UPI00265C58F5|nr:hypothetical protein [Streptomyces sp. DT2A-34]MDO0911305.1 hypothetical protein [Streptomyces sp. DT2A-34]